ncbi:MAG: beta-glucosidase [Candidatus Lokiarchaeota archaeon]|nr:beta-glucosidase [Candidatus Lokiarchaeota archaeon]MBD3338083.1 beta-glucosidase [Candidatus Lokiarchaeota archaeon]
MEKKENLLYLDETVSIERRIEDLLSRMNINEKIAQLTSHYVTEVLDKQNLSRKSLDRLLKHGIGQITRIGENSNLDPEDSVKIANKIQKYLNEETRLGIPAIVHEECLCGYTARKATIFPQIIGVASTWEPSLVEDMTQIISNQMRSVGAHQGLSPVLDIARDPRWGRTEETFGEDPYLVSRMGVAYVKGLQKNSLKEGIIATGKHFVGYGLSQGGRNWAPAYIPERELLEVFTRPFEAAIKEANMGSVMNAYSELDGIPCGFSRKLLTELLREKWNFKGIVVSDYGTLDLCSRLHQFTSSSSKAAHLALIAGLDVELPRRVAFSKKFIKIVKKGKIKEDVINIAVKRVLRKKFELGLFENPYVEEDPNKITLFFSDPKIKQKAKEIALKSIVLLKNENDVLPLSTDIKKLAVIGPNADSIRNLLGDYTFVGQYESTVNNATGFTDVYDTIPQETKKLLEGEDKDAFTRSLYEMQSILDAIKEKVSKNTAIFYSKGCNLNDENKDMFEEAKEIAEKSDLIIMVMGGKSGLVLECTSGESRDRSELILPGVQEDLIKEIYSIGKPIILVLINGRPLSITWERDNIPAIIEAWLPGQEGGPAVADILFGDYNPGGKLPICFPRSVGQIPIFHYCKPTGNIAVWAWNYVEENTTPLFPFGYGLSYTTFEYSNLRLSSNEINVDDFIEISLEVKNIGKIEGDEVIQLYIRDNEAGVTRPLEELIGFTRVSLRPNQIANVTFKIYMKQLGFYNEDMNYVVEPGTMLIYVGSIHALYPSKHLNLDDLFGRNDVKLKSNFKITGETKIIEDEKIFFSEISVEKS